MNVRGMPAMFLLLVGALLGGISVLGASAMAYSNTSKVRVITGYTTAVNESGTAIGLAPHRGGSEGEGYLVAGATWMDLTVPLGNSWHTGVSPEGHPTCLKPLTSGQEVTLGVVDVPATSDAPGRTVVVWLKCLSAPTYSWG